MKSLIAGLRRLVLPFGATTGVRIELDGVTGTIKFYDADNNLVGSLDPVTWQIGDIQNLGRRVTLSPLGGIRIRDDDDTLVVIIDEHGFTLNDPDTGQVTAELRHGSLRIIDQNGTDDIEMVTSTDGTLPNPVWRRQKEVNPGATITAPAAPTFTTPIDDFEIAHASAWKRVTVQAATMTPPAGMTEQHDDDFSDASAGTLHISTATRDPATGVAGDFTSTQSNWEHGLGQRVIIKGGGTNSPSFRSITTTPLFVTSEDDFIVSSSPPAGLADTDALVTFVDLGVSGGLVPLDWVTPQGFIQLGVDFSPSGSGSTQSTLSGGTWVKRVTSSEPATYETRIIFPPNSGTKIIQGTLVAVQNAFLVPGGVQIRLAGQPIRRELDRNVLTAASATLCDFTNISQAYSNLELQYDGTSNAGAGSEQVLRVRFNGDTGVRYYSKVVRDGAVALTDVALSRMRFGALNGLVAGPRSAGEIKIYGYAKSATTKPVVTGVNWWVGGNPAVQIHHETHSGQWDGSAGTGEPINRIQLEVDAAGATFAAGSSAILYGY